MNSIKAKIEEINMNRYSGELYIRIKPKRLSQSFYVFVEGKGRYSLRKGDEVEITLISLMPMEKSNKSIKQLKIGDEQHHLIDYVGKIIGTSDNFFVVDATLPLIVDKDPKFKIGDYVTANMNHDIQARIVPIEKE